MGGKYKICVYAICKNEEKFVGRWMDSVKDADLVVVTDTGSEDNTVARLKDRGAAVYEYIEKPFRFDRSRNYCLGQIPEDVDICISLDLDEIIQPNWREAIEGAWQKNTRLGRYLFNWKLDGNDIPLVQYHYDRIHSRNNFEWIYPTHEILMFTGAGAVVETFIPGLVVNHYPDNTKSRSFNLSLLELAVNENKSARNMHYLGREYMYMEDWENCIKTLTEYLNLPDARWNEEISASMRFIARSYAHLGDKENQRKWLYRAVGEAPNLREPYVELARLAYGEKDWLSVYYFSLEAIRIKEKTYSYANEIFAWNSEPYDLAAIGAYNLGNKKEAERLSAMAIEIEPDCERLKENHKFYIS